MNVTHFEEFPYDPNRLLDALRSGLNLANDAQLCRVLEVKPPIISKIRHFKLPIGPWMLIRMHEVTELSIQDLRALMGDRRKRFVSARLSPQSMNADPAV